MNFAGDKSYDEAYKKKDVPILPRTPDSHKVIDKMTTTVFEVRSMLTAEMKRNPEQFVFLERVHKQLNKVTDVATEYFENWKPGQG